MNKMAEGVLGDPRAHGIVRAIYASVGVEPKYF